MLSFFLSGFVKQTTKLTRHSSSQLYVLAMYNNYWRKPFDIVCVCVCGRGWGGGEASFLSGTGIGM